MSSELQGVSSEPMHAIVPPSPLNIGDMPQDVLNQIFRDVSLLDLQAVACVSRGMNRSVIALANSHELHSIKKFIRSLVQKLPEQKERLVEIAQNRFFQDCANLQQLKRSILDVKAQLIGVIKTVDVETAKGLHDVQPPHFLENIFTLAALERRIDEAHLIPHDPDNPDDYEKDYEFSIISQALAGAGDIERALEVAGLISHEATREGAFGEISRTLTRAGNMDRAVAIVTSIPSENTRWLLWSISRTLIRLGNMDRAVAFATSIAKLISNEDERGGEALGDISKFLVEAGDMDRAVVVASLIPDKDKRGSELSDISEALTQAGNIDRSLEVAGLIPNEIQRGSAFWGIVQALTRAGHMDRAIAVATSISDSWVREQALQDISHALTRKGDMARARAVAKLISVEDICSLQ